MTITMQRAMYILGHAYGLNGCEGISAIFQGAPGGGKTTLVREFARKYLDGRCLPMELSRLQGTDLNLPVPDHATKRVDFYANAKLADLVAEERGMLFFDEITRAADQGVLAASLNIFLDHELADLRFKHLHVWAACNPAATVGGIELDPAFANRLVLVEWPEDTDVESFADHVMACDPVTGQRSVENTWPEARDWKSAWPAAFEKASNGVIGFLRTRSDMLSEACPNVFRAWRSKRSWHTAIHVLAACEVHGASPAERKTLLGGAIGTEAAHAFVDWMVASNLPNPRDVIAGKVDLTKLKPQDLFLATSIAVDVYIADHNRGTAAPLKPFIDCLDAAADKNLEIASAQAGRLVAARIFDKDVTFKFYSKVTKLK